MHRELAPVLENLGHVVLGKPDVIQLAVTALLARGHVLIEDAPGVGKTTLARSLAKVLGLSSRRLQFTSDLLPSDVTGVSIYDPGAGTFVFREGPIFTNVLLADEINRSGPRTQSALLEAMSENTVSVDQGTRPLPEPFMVIATQNPIEHHGTYPLPDSELDRFLMRIPMGYPSHEAELRLVRDRQTADPMDALEPVLSGEKLLVLCDACRKVSAKDSVMEYILAMVEATRRHPAIELGVSPRGSLMLFRGCQARAFLEGRDYVLPDDVKALAVPVLAHRILLMSQNGHGRSEATSLLEEIVARVAVPL